MAASSSKSDGANSSSPEEETMLYSSSAPELSSLSSEGISYRELKLESNTELRIEVHPKLSLNVGVISGTAEVFGRQLDNWNVFPAGTSFAVFTWDGAVIRLEGKTQYEYISDETPMNSYRNVHAALEEQRTLAVNNLRASGPRVIVVGPQDSGKTSLSMMLINWAVKLCRTPLFVDLDVEQGSITLPGSIGAAAVDRPIDPVNGVQMDMNQPPLVYFYGEICPRAHVRLYKSLLKELAKTSETWLSSSTKKRTAGMIINTMSWSDNVESTEMLLCAIDTFQANVVLVLHEEFQENLYTTLKDRLHSKPNVDVVKLIKSHGVVPRNPKIRAKAIRFRVREYFYGPRGSDRAPYSHTASFPEIKGYRIGLWKPDKDWHCREPVAEMVNDTHLFNILAISFGTAKQDIFSSNVAGFIYVTSVDSTRGTFSYVTQREEDIQRRPAPGSPDAEDVSLKCFIVGKMHVNLEEEPEVPPYGLPRIETWVDL